MKIARTHFVCCLMLTLWAFVVPSQARAETRIALVVGNGAYQAGPLATAANDAGLIAQTLQAAGFDVSGARDLDAESLRQAFRDFVDKAQSSGPDTVAFVYLAGYGLQLEGENYFAPIDARIVAASDVASEAVRISDYIGRVASLPLKATFVVLDAARDNPFAKSGPPLAGGLALTDAGQNTLIAFNAAPGTVAPSENGPYGAYARALAEMIREGGLSPSEVFDGVRLRVNEETQGAEVPWHISKITVPFVFFERAAGAPAPALETGRLASLSAKPFRELSVEDAYAAAIQRDTIQGYQDFLAAFPESPMAGRIRALLAARREAITWRHSCHVNTPDAYWSYLERYPKGPHVDDARWRLEALSAPVAPPPSFTPITYDVPPPPPAEIIYVDRPVLVFSDPLFGFVPPPPVAFLAPVPATLTFPPPLVVAAPFVLPIPVFAPVPAYIDPPAYVAPPPNNVVFQNIHNTVVTNNITNVINQAGPPSVAGVHGATTAAAVVTGAAAAAIAAKVAMPPSVAKHAQAIETQGPRGTLPGQAPPAAPGQPRPGPGAMPPPAGHALPGMEGKPLPGQEKPAAPGQPRPGPGAPGAMPPPAGHVLPGMEGKPLPGHALPGGGEQPPLPGGHGAPGGAKPGPAKTPGVPPPHEPQPPRPPAAESTVPHHAAPPEGHEAPAAPRHPAIEPKAQPPEQPQRLQREHQPPQARVAPSAPRQSFRASPAPPRQPGPPHPAPQAGQFAPPPQARQWAPPSQAAHPARPAAALPQAWHPPLPSQPHPLPKQTQQFHPPAQRSCGTPGLPPCR